METFDKYILYDISTKNIYSVLQNIQNKLFKLVLIDTPCHSNVANLYIDINGGEMSISDSNLHYIKNTISKIKERYLVIGIIYKIDGNGHYGLMIMDKSNRTFRIFDPSFEQLNAQGIVSEMVESIENYTGYKYKPIQCFMSLQHETGDYYCSMWSFMLAYLSCKYSTDIGDVATFFSKKSTEYIDKQINGFIHYLYTLMMKKGLESESKLVSKFIDRVIHDNTLSDSSKQTLVNTVRYHEEPKLFIEELGLYQDLEKSEDVDLFYNYVSQVLKSHPMLLNYIRNISKPMDMKDYQKLVETIYSLNLSVNIYNILKQLYQETDKFIHEIKDISYTIKYNFKLDLVKEKINILKAKFCKFYGISMDDTIRMYSFISEFYLRYLYLDTYDISDKDSKSPMEFRVNKYAQMLANANIPMDTKLLSTMIYTPITYIDMDKFVYTLPVKINRDTIISSMLKASLIQTPGALSLYKTRLESML